MTPYSRLNSAAPGIKTGPEEATEWSFPVTLTSWTDGFPLQKHSRSAIEPIGVEAPSHPHCVHSALIQPQSSQIQSTRIELGLGGRSEGEPFYQSRLHK